MTTLIITHGDFDGVASAALLAKKLGISPKDVQVIFTQPFLVDKVEIPEHITKVYVTDLAINNRDPAMTTAFIHKLGDRLVAWHDHHLGWDRLHVHKWVQTHNMVCDPTAPSCAAMMGNLCNPLVVDAIVADTREGIMSTDGQMCEDAVKADLRNDAVRLAVVKFMMGDDTQRPILETAADKYEETRETTREMAGTYSVDGRTDAWIVRVHRAPEKVPRGTIAICDARKCASEYDLTQLLLEGQKLAKFAVVQHTSSHNGEDMVTIATKSKSDTNLVELFGLESGAPFRITIDNTHFKEAVEKLKNTQEVV